MLLAFALLCIAFKVRTCKQTHQMHNLACIVCTAFKSRNNVTALHDHAHVQFLSSQSFCALNHLDKQFQRKLTPLGTLGAQGSCWKYCHSHQVAPLVFQVHLRHSHFIVPKDSNIKDCESRSNHSPTVDWTDNSVPLSKGCKDAPPNCIELPTQQASTRGHENHK